MKKTALDRYVNAKVREQRIRHHLTRAAFAKYLQVSSGHIKRIEDPRFKLAYDINHINAMAAMFNCSPRDFLPEKAL